MMLIRKLLKYVLVFSSSMIILHTVPLYEVNCDDKYYITMAFCLIYLLIDIFIPSYTFKNVSVNKTNDSH